MNDEPHYRLVLHLHRWDRTKIALSLWERVKLIFTGSLPLGEMLNHGSIGWVPVFAIAEEAQHYQQTEAPDAPIVDVRRQLDI